ncbi:MAG: hypothetical protein OEZ19_11310, partial [Paracoccaceae bacterium]|nr:hypothetical protein [Paracoccaceae bacterium]
HLHNEVTETSTLIREYVWLDQIPRAVIENDQVYYIRTDHIGWPVFATNDLGVKVWECQRLSSPRKRGPRAGCGSLRVIPACAGMTGRARGG